MQTLFTKPAWHCLLLKRGSYRSNSYSVSFERTRRFSALCGLQLPARALCGVAPLCMGTASVVPGEQQGPASSFWDGVLPAGDPSGSAAVTGLWSEARTTLGLLIPEAAGSPSRETLASLLSPRSGLQPAGFCPLLRVPGFAKVAAFPPSSLPARRNLSSPDSQISCWCFLMRHPRGSTGFPNPAIVSRILLPQKQITQWK